MASICMRQRGCHTGITGACCCCKAVRLQADYSILGLGFRVLGFGECRPSAGKLLDIADPGFPGLPHKPYPRDLIRETTPALPCHLQVNFPLVLDCYEFCSEEYKRELDGPREAVQLLGDRRAGIARQKKATERKAAEEKEQAEKQANRKRPLSKVTSPR